MVKDKKIKVPNHVAIIMDGNGRWAKKRNLPRSFGHREGAKRVKEVIKQASKMGIKFLTLYTFSTENWKRPKIEVNFLFGFLEKTLRDDLKMLIKYDIRFNTIGRKDRLPKSLLKAVKDTKEATKENKGLVLTLALDYGGRWEIAEVVKKIAGDVIKEKIAVNEINQDVLSRYIGGSLKLPDPDLMIRTSNEKRLSNYLIWQLAYAEFCFLKTYWPDFTKDVFYKTIVDYSKRERRFGDVKANA